MMSWVKAWVREHYRESSCQIRFCNSLLWILFYLETNNSDNGITNVLIKFAANPKLRKIAHTFRSRIRNQDGFHKLKIESGKYVVLFGKCEVLMTGRNGQLHNPRNRAADWFRNFSKGGYKLNICSNTKLI